MRGTAMNDRSPPLHPLPHAVKQYDSRLWFLYPVVVYMYAKPANTHKIFIRQTGLCQAAFLRQVFLHFLPR